MDDREPDRPVRLQKILADHGIASRREAERLIAAGRVSVNGKAVTQLGSSANPTLDKIAVDGRLLEPLLPRRVLLLNKPIGYLSTCKPSREQGISLLELLPSDRRYFPVGRLDRDTSGLIIVTDDGDLALKLSHPRFESRKTYRVTTHRSLSDSQIEQLSSGVTLSDGPARALSVRRISQRRIELILGEGRNRQVRRMIRAVGANVANLERIAIGTLFLGDLKAGRWRELGPSEIKKLMA